MPDPRLWRPMLLPLVLLLVLPQGVPPVQASHHLTQQQQEQAWARSGVLFPEQGEAGPGRTGDLRETVLQEQSQLGTLAPEDALPESQGPAGPGRVAVLPLHSALVKDGIVYGSPKHNLARARLAQAQLQELASHIKALGPTWRDEAKELAQGEVGSTRGESPVEDSWGRRRRAGRRQAGLRPRRFASLAGSGLYNTTGEYQFQVGLGSPPQSLRFVLDTGSTAMWTACNLANSTSPPDSVPVLRTQASKTYSPVACISDTCNALALAEPDAFPPCNPGTTCPFRSTYGDNSTVRGFAATDIITLPSSAASGLPPIRAKVAFGCGVRTSGTIAMQQQLGVAGIIGFGPGADSVPGQLEAAGKLPWVFHLCLDSTNASGSHAVLGAVAPPPGTIGAGGSVPFQAEPLSLGISFYFVDVKMLYVGGKPVTGSEDLGFANFTGGIIVDSGTTYTTLPEFLRVPIVQMISGASGYLFQENLGGLFYCMPEGQPADLSKFPDIAISFGLRHRRWIIPPQTYMGELQLEATSNVTAWCLTVTPLAVDANSFLNGIIGESWLLDTFATFDVDKGIFKWAPQNCSQLTYLDPLPGAPAPEAPAAPPEAGGDVLSVSCRVETAWETGTQNVTQYACVVTNNGNLLVKDIQLTCTGFDPLRSWNIDADCSLPDYTVLGQMQSWQFGYQTVSAPATFAVASYSTPNPAISVAPASDPSLQAVALQCGVIGPTYIVGSDFVYQYGCTVSNSGSNETVSQIHLSCEGFFPDSNAYWNIDLNCSLPGAVLGPGGEWSFGFQTVENAVTFGVESYVLAE